MDALRQLGQRQEALYQDVVMFEQHVVMLEEAAGISLRQTHHVPQEDLAS